MSFMNPTAGFNKKDDTVTIGQSNKKEEKIEKKENYDTKSKLKKINSKRSWTESDISISCTNFNFQLV